MFYQLHAFNIRQRLENEHQQRLQRLSILAVIATLLVAVWIVLVQPARGSACWFSGKWIWRTNCWKKGAATRRRNDSCWSSGWRRKRRSRRRWS